MKKRAKIKRLSQITLLLAVMIYMTISAGDTAFAKETWPKAPDIQSKSAYVMEMNTGAVLYEKNSHKQCMLYQL